MAVIVLKKVVERLRRELSEGSPDSDLLERYIADRDETAFAELVERHGPKVYAICRRLLGQHQLAEDAYQATFVVLAKKAHSLHTRSAVGGFLYGVARKAALNAYAVSRRRKETLMDSVPDSRAAEYRAADSDVLAMLDEEIANLSETLRAAVVLCELDGVSRAKAAKQLGIAEGTLSSRLAAARKQLAAKLKARGVTFSLGLFATLTASANSAGAPVLEAATASVSTIAEGVLRTMFLAKLKVVTILGALIAVAIGLIGFVPNAGVDANAAPAMKAGKDDGLIWTYHSGSGELTAYTSAGEKDKTLKLKDTRQLLGLTRDGQKIIFIGKNGQLADPNVNDGLTVHVRDINDSTKGQDTGIEYKRGDQFRWSSDGKRVIRVRQLPYPNPDPATPTLPEFSNTLVDVETKEATPIEIVDDRPHKVLAWSPDDRWLLTSKFVEYKEGNVTQYRNHLFAYDLKSKKSRLICDSLYLPNCVVSPDGRTLLGAGRKHDDTQTLPRWAVVRVDVATGRVTELARHENQSGAQCRWSPSGDRVCYLSYDATSLKQARLFIGDADGRKVKTITIETPNGDAYLNPVLGWFPPRQ